MLKVGDRLLVIGEDEPGDPGSEVIEVMGPGETDTGNHEPEERYKIALLHEPHRGTTYIMGKTEAAEEMQNMEIIYSDRRTGNLQWTDRKASTLKDFNPHLMDFYWVSLHRTAAFVHEVGLGDATYVGQDSRGTTIWEAPTGRKFTVNRDLTAIGG